MPPRWKMDTGSCCQTDRYEDHSTACHCLCCLSGGLFTADISSHTDNCLIGLVCTVLCQFMGNYQWCIRHSQVLQSNSGMVQGGHKWGRQKVGQRAFVVMEQVSLSAVSHHEWHWFESEGRFLVQPLLFILSMTNLLRSPWQRHWRGDISYLEVWLLSSLNVY